MNNLFSLRRATLFARKDLAESLRALLIALGAVTGVLIISYALAEVPRLLSGTGGMSSDKAALSMHFTYFALMLFIGGFIMTSRSFIDLHAKGRNHDFLMLPASVFEKYIVRLLLTTVGVAIGSVAVFFLFSLLAAGAARLITGQYLVLFNPFSTRVWVLVANYVVTQSIFLLGAVYFKRAQFIRTVLVASAFIILLAVIGGIAFRLSFGSIFPGTFRIDAAALSGSAADVLRTRFEGFASTVWGVLRILYWAILGPLFWVVGYVRLAETEVRNGV